jgi:hypothetical protein
MKRVHYALGAAVALTPAAMGTAPHLAEHTVASSSAGTSGAIKTVSLNHSAAKAAVGVIPCTATSFGTVHLNSLIKSWGIWHNPLHSGRVCLGTESVHRYFKNTNCVSINFTVYYNSGSAGRKLYDRCGNAGSTKRFYSRFGLSFPVFAGEPYIEICVSSNYTEPYCGEA